MYKIEGSFINTNYEKICMINIFFDKYKYNLCVFSIIHVKTYIGVFPIIHVKVR